MTTPLFVINAQDAYAGTEGLALGTFAAHPEKPSVAHVVQGQVAVWASGQHGQCWSLQPATSTQIAAYDRAPRVAVSAQPPSPPARTVPTSVAAVLGVPKPAAGGNSWDAILAMAMQSGLMTPGDLQAALPLLASDAKPSHEPRAAQNVWDEVIAKMGGQRQAAAPAQKTTLDSAAIYVRPNEQRSDAAALWDRAIAAMSNTQRN